MNTNELIKRLLESEQQFADCLTACKENPEYDPRYTALPIAIAEEIFREILEAQEELLAALERLDDQSHTGQNSAGPP